MEELRKCMRIMHFSPRDCWPPTSGARLRDYNLARELGRRGELTYLGFGTGDETWRGWVGDVPQVRCILAPKPERYTAGNIVRGITGPLPVTVRNFSTQQMRIQLQELLAAERFHLVQMEGVHLFDYAEMIFSRPERPKLVCDWHNIESELMRRYAENLSPANPRRWYAARTAELIEALEQRLLERCDAHLVCSEREKSALLKRAPGAVVRVVENGVDTAAWASPEDGAAGRRDSDHSAAGRRDLVFVGSMNYHANIDAVLWFARDVWPAIRAQSPDLRFVVVGSNPAPEVRALSQEAGIAVTGTVDRIAPYYARALASVVPLRVGSGTRLKVLEAMAAGVPVISTTLGAEGLRVEAGRNILLGDSPQELANAVASVASDEGLRKRVAAAGRERAAEYDWGRIGGSLAGYYAQLVETESVGK